MSITLYLAIPCYNEEEVLPETAKRLKEKFSALRKAGTITAESRACFIDDGSKDKTWELIYQLKQQDAMFSGMDEDLQDDINAIDGMLEKFQEGCDVVYGVRSKRETDTAFKRITAEGFYRVMKALGADVVFNHADYRLMSRRALDALAEYKEVNLFLRGMVPLVGYRSGVVYYERAERFAGESKYPLKKMISFAWEGISSLSVKPMKLITRLGIVMFGISILMLIWFFIRHFTGHTVTGWSSLAVSLWAIGGLQLLATGIVGEYIGKIYLETKGRPRYLAEMILDDWKGAQ